MNTIVSLICISFIKERDFCILSEFICITYLYFSDEREIFYILVKNKRYIHIICILVIKERDFSDVYT